MGAHQAFLNLPDKTAVAEITRLVAARDYDTLIGALKALKGDIEQRLHVELSNCYVALHDRLEENASKWADLGTQATAAGEVAHASKARRKRDKLARDWARAGKLDVLNELHERHPELWEYQNSKCPRWRTIMWRRAGLKWIRDSRPG